MKTRTALIAFAVLVPCWIRAQDVRDDKRQVRQGPQPAVRDLRGVRSGDAELRDLAARESAELRSLNAKQDARIAEIRRAAEAKVAGVVREFDAKRKAVQDRYGRQRKTQGQAVQEDRRGVREDKREVVP